MSELTLKNYGKKTIKHGGEKRIVQKSKELSCILQMRAKG
jgi:hypothetical protein